MSSTIHALPTADEYAAAARRRSLRLGAAGLLLAALVAGSLVAIDNPLLPLALLIAVVTPILLWRFPRFGLYFVLAAACLFELDLLQGPEGMPFKDSLTDRVPLFWNINTICQTYAHSNFKAVPLSLFEVFILIAGVCSCLRSVYTKTTSLRAGVLFWPICIYLVFVGLGWINGALSGGDFKISLQETRPQIYFGLAYLMAVNGVRKEAQIDALLWMTAIWIGLKGLLLTVRRFVTLHGMAIPDQGVGAHEEAFFFSAFMALLFALRLNGVLPRLQRLMWALLPFVVLGDLACNRRAGTAALALVAPLLFLAAYQVFPARRRLLVIVGLSLAVAGTAYYSVFKNSDSLIAQPARAIRSNFQPDARDASSNAARDAENANLMATIRSTPLQGWGYGKPYLHVVPMADISSIYALEDYIPHNQILWIWERVGSFGFLAFWMMMAAILICAGRTIRAPGADGRTRAIGMFTLSVTVMLLVFGLLDLQLSNFRDVLFAGLWVGVLAVLPLLPDQPLPDQEPSALGRRNRP